MQKNNLFHTDPAIYAANEALCKNYLTQYENAAINQDLHLAGLGNMAFFTIHGLTRFWEDGKQEPSVQGLDLMQQMLTGLSTSDLAFAFMLIGTSKGI